MLIWCVIFIFIFREAYYARKSEERKTRKVEQKPSSGTANEPESEAPSRIKTKGAIIFFKGSSLDTTREKLKVRPRMVGWRGGGRRG